MRLAPARPLALALASLLALTACAGGGTPEQSAPEGGHSSSPTPSAASPEPSETAAAETVISLSAMGDWLPHNSVVADAKTDTGYDFAQMFSDVAPIWEGDDLVYCNQEVVTAASLPLSSYPLFNVPTELVRDMDAVGCNVIGFGNNHTFDFGEQGVTETLAEWGEVGPLLFAGARGADDDILTISTAEVHGVTVAFVSFLTLSNNPVNEQMVDFLDDHERRQAIMAEAAKADVTIVGVHWGDEYSHEPNAFQREYAQTLVDEGADVIIGTHPHVVQPIEFIEREDGTRVPVMYSLGNMLSSQMEEDRLVGMVAQLEIVVTDEAVDVRNVRSVPTYMHFNMTPQERDDWTLDARHAMHLYPLWEAEEPLTRSAWRDRTSQEALMAAYRDWAGDAAPVVESWESLAEYR